MKKEACKFYKKDKRRIVKGLGFFKGAKLKNLKQLVKFSKEKYGEKVAFRYKENNNIVEKSYIDFATDIDCFGTALCTSGLKGCKVALIGENRYEWAVSYLSVANGVGVIVPLDKHLPELEIKNLLERSECEAIIFSKKYKEYMENIALVNKNIKLFICMDDIILDKAKKFVSMKYMMEVGSKELIKNNKVFVDAKIDEEKMSVLLFTSGTTSAAKGVMLTHSNIAANINSCAGLIEGKEDDIHLSLLPLHHTFENTIGFLFLVYSGICISYCRGIKYLAQDLKEFDASIIIAVPAIYEAIYKKMKDGIRKSGKEGLINKLEAFSEFLYRHGIDFRRQLMTPVRKKLAPRLRIAVSGAAAINPEIIEAFERMGIRFIQGYGLTETSPLVCATSPFKNMAGSIGYPVKDVEIALDNIDENRIGELIVRGKNVTSGYYKNEAETKNAFTKDGWLKTGDLAVFSKDGSVKLVGREKSMIVFPNGKKAFPEEYEELLNEADFIKESFVWGYKTKENDVEICAKIVVDSKTNQEDVIAKIENRIKEINANIPKYKILRYFIVTKEELIKTTTLKIKRPLEEKKTLEFIEKTGKDMRKLNKTFIEF